MHVLQLGTRGLGGQNFQNSKVRIHLSGDPSLRNGLISNICTMAPDEVKKQFAELEHAKREEKHARVQKHIRMNQLLDSRTTTAASASPAKQSKLGFTPDSLALT